MQEPTDAPPITTAGAVAMAPSSPLATPASLTSGEDGWADHEDGETKSRGVSTVAPGASAFSQVTSE